MLKEKKISPILSPSQMTVRVVDGAVGDIFSVIPETIQKNDISAGRWHPLVFLELGHSLKLLNQTDTGEEYHAAYEIVRRFAETTASDQPVVINFEEDKLLVRVSSSALSKSSFIAVVTKKDFDFFLTNTFPEIHLTSALQRLLMLHLAGFSLKDGAKLDERSVDTRKRQSQQLRAAFGIDELATIGRHVSNALILGLDRYVYPQNSIISKSLSEYVAMYMPKDTRLYALSDSNGQNFNILDMGPVDGIPILTLHAMTLPDIRKQDLTLLNDLGLRLIWPLRHGICAPDAMLLQPQEHLNHALTGAGLALKILCNGKAQILAFAAASKIGIELARTNPEAIKALHIAGVCVREGRPESGARRLARGIMSLATHNPALLTLILGRLETVLRKPETFIAFMRHQFAGIPPDLAIIEVELSNSYGLKRFQSALLDSAMSARHDFLFQNNLGWHLAPSDLSIYLHHGEMDGIHPMELIIKLAEQLPDAKIYSYKNTGQLFYHHHLKDLLENIVKISSSKMVRA